MSCAKYLAVLNGLFDTPWQTSIVGLSIKETFLNPLCVVLLAPASSSRRFKSHPHCCPLACIKAPIFFIAQIVLSDAASKPCRNILFFLVRKSIGYFPEKKHE